MQKKKIGIAIVGYGYWGPNLARNFNEIEDAAVIACCDQNPERLGKIQSKIPGIRVTSEFESLLNASDINAIIIATPPQTHYRFARAALDAGKHVFVEKPFTTRVDHADELVALADKKGLVLMVDHVFVFSPAVIKMKEIIDSGRLGKLYFIDSVRINLGLFQNDVNVVWDLAPHDLSIVDYLLNRSPLTVSAFGGNHTSDTAMEDVAYLHLNFGDQLIANFHVNWLSPVKIRSMIVGGSSQSLIFDDLHPSEKIKVFDRGVDIQTNPDLRRNALISYRTGDVWSPNIRNEEPLSHVTRHFITCIQQAKRPISDGQAGLRIVKILEAAESSIKTGGSAIAIHPAQKS